jgi:PAS domain S-box-containing protein
MDTPKNPGKDARREDGLLAEQLLHLLDSAVRQSKESIVITDADLVAPGPRIVFVNPAFTRMTGYTREDALGRSPRILQGPRTDREVLRRLRSNLERGEAFEGEAVNYRKNGEEFFMEWQITPIRDPKGTVTHYVAIQRDVTERKRLEEASGRLAAIVECSEDAIIGKDLNSIVNTWNKGAEKIFGYSAKEMIGKPITQIIPGDRLDEETQIMERIRAGRSVDHFETLRIRKDGRVINVSVTASPIVDKDGRIVGASKSARDITEQRKALQKIAEQAAFMDKARDAIIVRDLDGTVIYWNKGAEIVYGWTAAAAIGRNIRDLIYKVPESFTVPNEITLRDGEWQGELDQVAKDRRERSIDARWTLIRDDEGKPKAVLAINTDVTERKKIEAQFMRAQRMESIGTLAGGIAHDLNNILTPIMMSIEMLKLTSSDPESAEVLETIDQSARRGASIVRQVLSFARGIQGERVHVQPRHVINDLVSIIRDTFPKSVHLEFNVAGDAWPILGDPTQIHQVLLNLCVNARDAMPLGGRLSIGVENVVLDEHYAAMNLQAKPGRYVNIRVTDTGTGIPEAIIDKIFEPFFTTKEINKGTGLGLSTVMALVKSHEGIINVYSEPGRGSTFKVYFPASGSSGGEEGAQADQASLPRGKGETILVVDDEASVLSITGQTLQAFGYKVLSASDGAEALAVYIQNKDSIELILTDIMMPVMDGHALIHAVLRMNRSVKIVAASGLNSNGDMAKASGMGIKHFLTKPYTARTLLKTLRDVLDSK